MFAFATWELICGVHFRSLEKCGSQVFEWIYNINWWITDKYWPKYITIDIFFPTELLGSWLSPSGKVRNLGVIFDSRLSLTQHVSAVCSSCYYHIRDLSRIRRHLSISVASQIANALVTSRLDYCNSLLSSLTAKDLKRLQSVQNTIARIVTRTPRRSSISPVLKSLHWLPVKFRIKFKMGVLIYKALANGKPDYLASLLTLYSSSYNTRRSNPELRFLKHYNIGSKVSSNRHLSHSFQDAAPRLWNSFPLSVRTASSLTTFRCRLKTHLFSLAYPPWFLLCTGVTQPSDLRPCFCL